MSWYALEPLQDALDDTKELLWPFELWTWLRLAVIVFFVGGPGSSLGGSTDGLTQALGDGAGEGFGSGFGDGGVGGTAGTGPLTDGGLADGTGGLDAVLAEHGDVIAIVLGVVAVVVLIFTLLGAIFEFVFYRVLEDGDVRLRGPFDAHALDGAKYFLFRLAVMLIVLASVAVPVGLLIVEPGLGLVAALAMIPVWLAIWILSFAVRTLALPEIVVEDCGFVEGVRRALGYLRDEWKQGAVFLLAHVVVGIAASVLAALGVLVGLLVIGIPLAILGGVLYVVASWLVVVPILLGVVGLLAVVTAVAVPIQTYVYRWVLHVHAGFAGRR